MSAIYGWFPNTPPWLVTVILFVLLVVVLYMGRGAAHGVIASFFKMLYSSLRLGARSVVIAERRLKDRNREVLVALGKQQAEIWAVTPSCSDRFKSKSHKSTKTIKKAAKYRRRRRSGWRPLNRWPSCT